MGSWLKSVSTKYTEQFPETGPWETNLSYHSISLLEIYYFKTLGPCKSLLFLFLLLLVEVKTYLLARVFALKFLNLPTNINKSMFLCHEFK